MLLRNYNLAVYDFVHPLSCYILHMYTDKRPINPSTATAHHHVVAKFFKFIYFYWSIALSRSRGCSEGIWVTVS